MYELLEIIGRGLDINPCELISRHLDYQYASTSATDSPDEQIDNIMRLFNAHKYDSAQLQTTVYLIKNPDSIAGRLIAAAIDIENASIQSAVEHLEFLYRHNPSNTIVLYTIAYCYERLGQPEKALEFYQDCLKFKKGLRLPSHRMAAIYLLRGSLAKAIEQYKIITQQYPDDTCSLNLLGQLYLATKDYDSAAKSFDRAILITPDSVNPESKNQDLTQSYQTLENLTDKLAENPEDLALLLEYADALASLGNTSDAIQAYQNAVNAHPQSLDARLKLAGALLHNEQNDDAELHINYAIEINENIVAAYIGLASAQYLLNKKNQAKSTFSMAAAVHQNTPILFAQLTLLKYRDVLGVSPEQSQNFPQLMFQITCQHVKNNQNSADAWYYNGIAALACENPRQAQKSLEHAIKLNCHHLRAKQALITTLSLLNENSRAAVLASSYELPNSKTIELYYKTAVLYCNNVKFASSLLNFQKNLDNAYTELQPAGDINIILQNLGIVDRPKARIDDLAAMLQPVTKHN
jgi:tetratricopeptide (TPR) repeat protein